MALHARRQIAPTPPASFRRARLMAALHDLDRRTTEINQRLDLIGPHGYEAQELRDERATLRTHRNRLQDQLRDLDAPPRPDTDTERLERYERRVAREVAERRAAREHFVRSLERAGEHQQVKIHRLAMLEIDAEVRREFGDP